MNYLRRRESRRQVSRAAKSARTAVLPGFATTRASRRHRHDDASMMMILSLMIYARCDEMKERQASPLPASRRRCYFVRAKVYSYARKRARPPFNARPRDCRSFIIIARQDDLPPCMPLPSAAALWRLQEKSSRPT